MSQTQGTTYKQFYSGTCEMTDASMMPLLQFSFNPHHSRSLQGSISFVYRVAPPCCRSHVAKEIRAWEWPTEPWIAWKLARVNGPICSGFSAAECRLCRAGPGTRDQKLARTRCKPATLELSWILSQKSPQTQTTEH